MALSRVVVGDVSSCSCAVRDRQRVALPSRLPRGVSPQGFLRPRKLPLTSFPSSHQQQQRAILSVRAGAVKTDGPVTDRWWEKSMPPNMADLHSTQEFVEALSEAGEKLVVVDFFATWCGSCRALFPKLCKLAAEYPEVMFYKIELDENKALCKSLNIRVLPFFHFYRGADGRLDAFPASLSKLQRLKDALAMHSTERCSLGPPAGPEQVLHPDLVPEATAAPPPMAR